MVIMILTRELHVITGMPVIHYNKNMIHLSCGGRYAKVWSRRLSVAVG